MSDKQFTIDDMIGAAGKESPSEFQTAFSALVLDKISDAIQAKKIEVAKNYFNYEENPAEDSEEETTAELETDEDEETPNENIEATAGESGEA